MSSFLRVNNVPCFFVFCFFFSFSFLSFFFFFKYILRASVIAARISRGREHQERQDVRKETTEGRCAQEGELPGSEGSEGGRRSSEAAAAGVEGTGDSTGRREHPLFGECCFWRPCVRGQVLRVCCSWADLETFSLVVGHCLFPGLAVVGELLQHRLHIGQPKTETGRSPLQHL